MEKKYLPKPKASKPKSERPEKPVFRMKKNFTYLNESYGVIVRALPQEKDDEAGEAEHNYFIINLLSFYDNGRYTNELKTVTPKELKELLHLPKNSQIRF